MTWTRATTGRIIALGALIGFMVSLTSIGSGGAIMLGAKGRAQSPGDRDRSQDGE